MPKQVKNKAWHCAERLLNPQESKLIQSKHKRSILQVYETRSILNCENGDMQRSALFTLAHKLLEFLYIDTEDC